MRSALHELALKVGYEVVNVEDDYTDYEYTENLSNVESVSYIIKVYDNASSEEAELTFYAIIDVLPSKLKKRINKLIKRQDISKDEKAIELAVFAVEEYRAQCDYTYLLQYGQLLNVDIEALGYHFMYVMPKKLRREIVAKIEQAVPMEYAPALGKIKKLEYKIGYVREKHIATQGKK